MKHLHQEQNELILQLRTQWDELCSPASNEEYKAEIFALLVTLYGELHRAYHNLNHVKALLKLTAEFREQLADWKTVAFAVWFHDAIYNPQSGDNEERSAELAVECVRKLGVSEIQIENIRQMILATKTHNADLLSADGKLFLDFDLSILGADAEVYQEYSAAIRREYDFVPEVLYRNGRRGILQNFLKRDFIYLTDDCRERFEARARQNLKAEIAELSS